VKDAVKDANEEDNDDIGVVSPSPLLLSFLPASIILRYVILLMPLNTLAFSG